MVNDQVTGITSFLVFSLVVFFSLLCIYIMPYPFRFVNSIFRIFKCSTLIFVVFNSRNCLFCLFCCKNGSNSTEVCEFFQQKGIFGTELRLQYGFGRVSSWGHSRSMRSAGVHKRRVTWLHAKHRRAKYPRCARPHSG